MEHIKQHIEERLWNFIKRSHNSEDYKNAILDSIQFVGDIIREKSGLDNDGNQLIGGAFGGVNPKIKLNKFKTESEKNVQKGTESILRGIYSAYRNPRSHSSVNDTEQDAFEVIIFINHLLKLIDKSKGKFSTELFLRRVFDSDFVQNKKYAELLVKEVPKNKVFETSIEIFRNKEAGDANNLGLVWESLKSQLNEEENSEIIKLVSEELRYTDSLNTVTRCIALFSSNWNSIDEDARLRAENKLIQIIPQGEKNVLGQTNEPGAYASWLQSILKVSLLRREIADKLYEALESPNEDRQRFVVDFFGYQLESLEEDILFTPFKGLFKELLSKGNRLIYDFIHVNYHNTNDYKNELENFVQAPEDDDFPF